MAKVFGYSPEEGDWGNKIWKPHIVLVKIIGKCGAGIVIMVPDPRGAGIVVACVPKKVLQFAEIKDVFTSSRGSTKTLENFVKAVKTLEEYPQSTEHYEDIDAAWSCMT